MCANVEHIPAGIAEVAVPGVDKVFDYRIPEPLGHAAAPGVRVRVPLGRRQVIGYLVGRRERSEHPGLKPLREVLDPWPLVTDEMLRLTRWIADYYFAPWGTVIRSALPAGIDGATSLQVRLTQEGRCAGSVSPLFRKIREALGKRTLSLRLLERLVGTRDLRARVLEYRRKGLVDVREAIRRPVGGCLERVYIPAEGIAGRSGNLTERAPAQAKVLACFGVSPEPLAGPEIRRRTGVSEGVIRRMVETSLLVERSRERMRDPWAGEDVERADPPRLSTEQAAAVAEIRSSLDKEEFRTFLLHGVTGSGKTEVYLQAMETALARGREALAIVPEIALTPQLVRTFRSRFGDGIALLHSGLSTGERYDQWNRIRRGEVRLAVGARSAVFAPFSSLGLIVVDEEHDTGYKQDETPRYHARDVAVVRGKMCGATVILGGATPSVESFHHAREGKYRLLRLRERVEGRPLPHVTIIDRKDAGGPGPLSPELVRAVQEGLERREQILLFLNRRGFAPFLLCRRCGFVLRCPNCSVSLTYHRAEGSLRCHHCGYVSKSERTCSDCGGESLEPQGVGTERIEHEVAELFAGSALLRLDRDTSRRKGAAKRILDRFLARDGDILIGTQMVAKGHHLPGVSIVGVLNADASLHLPDFRAAERTFQLLTQVAGRAGRGETPGRVFLQTYTPEHYAVTAARDQDYARFFDEEIGLRKALNYPPYCRLIQVVLAANSVSRVEEAASRLARILRNATRRRRGVEVLGPARPPLATLRGKKRSQILIKGKQVRSLHAAAREALARFSRGGGSGVDVVVDVDPVNFF